MEEPVRLHCHQFDQVPCAMDGMNETGLTGGILYPSGFSKYLDRVANEEATTLSNMDLAGYILGQYSHTQEIKAALPDANSSVPKAARFLHNFDIPKGLVRAGEHAGKTMAGQIQCTGIGDIRNRRYYYRTEYNHGMRLVDLSKLNFSGIKVQAIRLDEFRRENNQDHTHDF